MPLITIDDLSVSEAKVEIVRPAGGLPYVQATIDYVLLNDAGEPVIRKTVVKFGPNSGLTSDQHIHPYIAEALETAIERVNTLFKVYEGILPPEALESEPAEQLPSGVVWTYE